MAGPGYDAAGEWYAGVRYREEAARGLDDREDLWHAGHVRRRTSRPGETLTVHAWAGDLADEPSGSTSWRARARARALTAARPTTSSTRSSCSPPTSSSSPGPTVVAGYPWFGDWSRDTMTSYEGLFLEPGRTDEGRALPDAAPRRR